MKVFRFYNKDILGGIYNICKTTHGTTVRLPVGNTFISGSQCLRLSKNISIEGLATFSLIKTSMFYMHLVGIISSDNPTIEFHHNDILDFSKSLNLDTPHKLYLYEVDYTKTDPEIEIENDIPSLPDIALEVMEGTVDECMLWKLTSQEPVYCFSD